MNRSIIYSGEQPRTFDLLWGWKDQLTALGAVEVALGGNTSTVVAGLQASQSGPPSLTVNLASGSIFQQAAIDTGPYGSLPSDPTLVQQQGIAALQQITFTTAALAAGQSQWALVQAQFSQSDAIRAGDPTGGLLFYFNSADPTTPFQGPGGNGQTQPTERLGNVVIQIVYGSPATTGSEVPPNPTAGFVPLYLVDLAFGQSAVLTGQILVAGPSVGTNVPSNYPAAPFVAGLFNQHHLGKGAGQAPQIDLTSEVKNVLPLANLPASNTTGGGLPVMKLHAGNPNGAVAGNANVNGAQDLCWDLTNKIFYTCTTTGTTSTAVWTAVVGATTSQFAGGTSTGSANAQVVASVTPAGFSLTSGFVVNFTAGFTNTGAATLNVSGTGAIAINKAGPVPLTGGEIAIGAFVSVIYTGTVWLIQSAQLGQLATLNIGAWLKNDGSGNLTIKNGLTLGDDGAGNFTVQSGSILPAMLSAAGAPMARVGTQPADNLLLSNDATNGTFVVDISAGRVRDDSDVTNLQLAQAITKRLDQSWAGGSGNGGCDVSTKGLNQTWHAYLIGKTGMVPTSISRTSNVASVTIATHGLGVGDSARVQGQGGGFDGLQVVTSVTTNTFNYSNAGSNVGAGSPAATCTVDGIDALFSQSYPSPTMPSGWNVKQCLGSVMTDGSANIIAFTQVGDEFMWVTPFVDTPASIPTSSRLVVTLHVPNGLKVVAHTTWSINGQINEVLYITCLENPDAAANSATAFSVEVGNVSGAAFAASQVDVRTNVSQQVGARAATGSVCPCITHGYRDPRRRLF